MSNQVPVTIMNALLASMTSPSSLGGRLPCRVLAYRESIPAGLSGSYVALTGAGQALQVGLLSDVLGWQALSRVSDANDVSGRDAMLEAAGQLVTEAVGVFCASRADSNQFTLGLPLFVEGSVLVGAATELQAADIVLGSTRALLVVLTPRALSAAPAVDGNDSE